VLLFLLFWLAPGAWSQQPTASPRPIITIVSGVSEEQKQKRKETFELVWETVNKHFYDPNFNGLNWKAVHDRYAPQVARARSDAELYVLLQMMVNELRQSHFWVIPPESIPKVRPSAADQSERTKKAEDTNTEPEEETALDLIKEALADQLSTGIGVDVRVINRLVVITRVTPGSPAARAGLRPGFVVKSVNGKTSAQALAELEHPVFRDIVSPLLPMVLVADFMNGDGSDTIDLTYLDGRNLPRRARLVPEKLTGEMSEAIGNMPPTYSEFEAKRLSGGIGYIRFNAFVPSLMRKTCAALRDMHDAPGIILDLRGNEGGLLGMVSGLGGLLQGYSSVFGMMKTRFDATPVSVWPQRRPYERPLVILVDGSTQSAAEILADGLQASGRAVVVGEVSAGSTLPSAVIKLPTGALFQYAFGNYETQNGVRLEGRGVVPDAIVKLTRAGLLRTGDPQLARALEKLRERISWEGKELVVRVNEASVASDLPRAEVLDPPPPKPASSPTPKIAEPKPVDDENTRLAKQIVSRYIEAIGGEAAFLKITSRVSKGTVELAMELKGTVEIYEVAPNRNSMMMNIEGFGMVQTTFDCHGSWIHDPLRGYLRLSAGGTTEDTFHRELELLWRVDSMRFERKDKVGSEDCLVLVQKVGDIAVQQLYFSVVTGLLMRQNDTYLEDYRQVDGVKIPFVARQEDTFGRESTVVRLKEVKHNVPIDEKKFTEPADCFTKPDQKWGLEK
jgi:carboxyl-terminal processing protease